MVFLTIALVIWQFNRALKLETARTQDAEQAREALERVAATLRETETILKRERDFGVLVMGAMGGTLHVTSRVGKGTKLRLTFPVDGVRP